MTLRVTLYVTLLKKGSHALTPIYTRVFREM